MRHGLQPGTENRHKWMQTQVTKAVGGYFGLILGECVHQGAEAAVKGGGNHCGSYAHGEGQKKRPTSSSKRRRGGENHSRQRNALVQAGDVAGTGWGCAHFRGDSGGAGRGACWKRNMCMWKRSAGNSHGQR